MKFKTKDSKNMYIAKTLVEEGIVKNIQGTPHTVSSGYWLTNGHWAFEMKALNPRDVDNELIHLSPEPGKTLKWDGGNVANVDFPVISQLFSNADNLIEPTVLEVRFGPKLSATIWKSKDNKIIFGIDQIYSEHLVFNLQATICVNTENDAGIITKDGKIIGLIMGMRLKDSEEVLRRSFPYVEESSEGMAA